MNVNTHFTICIQVFHLLNFQFNCALQFKNVALIQRVEKLAIYLRGFTHDHLIYISGKILQINNIQYNSYGALHQSVNCFPNQ